MSKLLFLNPWVLLGCLAALAGVYFLGSSHGYTRGEASMQEVVAEMEKQEAIRSKAETVKVQMISDSAATAWLKAKELEAQLAVAKENVMIKWKTKIVPGTCGISDDTADMVRAIMDLKGKTK